MGETYYDRLGVAADASTEEINAAYRERLKETHPDVSDDPDAEVDTRALIEARDVLTDDAERARYDRLGHERYVEYHDSFVQPGAEDVASADPHDRAGSAGAAAGAGATGSTGAGAEAGAGAGTADGRGTGDWNTAADGQAGDRQTDRDASNSRRRERRRRQNEQTRATWNAAGQHAAGQHAAGQHAAGASDAATAAGESYAREWHAWNTGSPHRVHPTDTSTIGNRLYPPGPSLILLVTAFAVYPVILWATVTPSFPLSINLVVGLCLLGIVAYLQSMPGVGVVVFGAWTVLLPALLVVGFGVPLFSLAVLVAVCGTALPFGLSLLTRAVLRW